MVRVVYQPIGVIHSDYKQKEGVPIQGALSKNSRGRVEVFPEYQPGLKDLEGFSHIILVYHFHLAKRYSLLTRPFLEDEEHGIFACRAPIRPNPIGISIVKLEKIIGNILHVSDVDMVDGTPLLDIKPYVSRFDARTDTKDGWLTEKLKDIKEHKADGRYGR
jgi:tRNA-Thr(GGU) m(6)t(6)A37 methyltransferase TsaA